MVLHELVSSLSTCSAFITQMLLTQCNSATGKAPIPAPGQHVLSSRPHYRNRHGPLSRRLDSHHHPNYESARSAAKNTGATCIWFRVVFWYIGIYYRKVLFNSPINVFLCHISLSTCQLSIALNTVDTREIIRLSNVTKFSRQANSQGRYCATAILQSVDRAVLRLLEDHGIRLRGVLRHDSFLYHSC